MDPEAWEMAADGKKNEPIKKIFHDQPKTTPKCGSDAICGTCLGVFIPKSAINALKGQDIAEGYIH